MFSVRPAAFANQFYPGNKQELKEQIKEFLSKAKPPSAISGQAKEIKGKIRALISPHAGYQYSGPISAYGYKAIKQSTVNRQLSKVKSQLSNVLLVGPSHHMMFSGIALTNFELWQTPLGNIPSSSLYEKLDDKINFKLLNEAHAFEHSIEVQLPFLQTVLKDFRITPLLTGRVDRHKEIAVKLKEYINDNTLLIVSSDLSHYRPYKEAKRCDSETVKQILSLDANIDQEQACGADGIKILIELAKMLKWKVKLLDYRNSGDTAGDKSQVVGYAAIVFYE